MQLVFHAGAHFTEAERLLKCLLRNKETLQPKGIAVPGPGKYRKLLRQTLASMSDGTLTADAQEILLDEILDGEVPDRVILSNPHFFGIPRAVVRKGVLYPKAPERAAHLAQLFAPNQIELFMAIRDPASFLPACFEKSQHTSMIDFMNGVDPRAIRWSDTLQRMRAAAPEIPITVWCYEDAPLVWSQVIRETAGLEHHDRIKGSFELLGDIMSEQGMARFDKYIEAKPQMTEIQIRRVIAAFLEKFALDEKIEEVIDLPGWTDDLVSELSDIYDEDMLTLARIPGVQLISP